jgi:hypothetical protein
MPQINYTPQDAASLDRLLKQVEDAGTAIKRVLDEMEKFKIKVLDVPNLTILIRALDDVDSFAAGAKKAVRRHRKDRGEFRAATPDAASVKPAKAKR